ncbi:hypothetical protein [Sphingobacterium thalpophilum]|uniref:hypothetical protein n=1 Tax=Sphingobacterium thalpophilum TaxID=259 RepID=UPI002D77BA26|nr:hypothetical protein [Sphingobacterium thalpophilum]
MVYLSTNQLLTNFDRSSGFHRDGIGISSSPPEEIPMKNACRTDGPPEQGQNLGRSWSEERQKIPSYSGTFAAPNKYF